MKRGEYVPGEDGEPGTWLLDTGVVQASPPIDLTEHIRHVRLETDRGVLSFDAILRFEVIPHPDDD